MALKNVYATVAQTVGKGLTSARLLPETVPPRDARLKHWAFTLPRVHDVKAMNELDMPWWTYRAISYVDAWLSARPHPIRVFEYGSGASTAYLRRRVDEIHSVENHKGFADFVGPMLAEAGEVDLAVREGVPSPSPVIGSQKPGYANQDFADYVAVIDEVGGLFDLIVVDGRAREACLERAIPHLKDDGIIVFDNTHRARYKAAIAKEIAVHGLVERRMFGLTPTLPYPDQTTILSRR